MGQTMTRSKVWNMPTPDLEPDSSSVARCSDADLDRRSAVARYEVADLEGDNRRA